MIDREYLQAVAHDAICLYCYYISRGVADYRAEDLAVATLDYGKGKPMTPFLHKVALELERARGKHAQPINSPHEGYAVILEEVDEFWDLVKSQRPEPAKLLEELVQIAAMAERVAEDCGLIDPNYDRPLEIGWLQDVLRKA